MAFDSWVAFALACAVLTLIPGPSVLLVIGQALSKGKKAALICILGDAVGSVVLMVLSFMGVGAILAASAVLFQAVKWAGILYLAFLGGSMIKQARYDGMSLGGDEEVEGASTGSFWVGAITGILNPKAVIFYMAFLAQFIDPATNMTLQVVILISTSTIVLSVILIGYALIAHRAQRAFQSKVARKRLGYAGGALMLGGSALMVVTR